MFNSKHSIVRRLIFGFALTLSLLIGFGYLINTPVHSSDPPVLTLDAGNGIKAEFSNYSLTNYSETNGVYSGKFCFTLKNTSQQPSSQLPFFLTSFGYISSDLSGTSVHKTLNYSIEGSFMGSGPIGNAARFGFPSGFLYLASSGSYFPGTYPYDGIPPGGTASFCFVLEKNSPFTLNELINEFAIVFSDGTPAYIEVHGQNDVSNGASFFLDSLDANQMCFGVSQCGGETITGIGLDLPGNRGPFELFSSTNNTNFRLTSLPHRLRYLIYGRSGRADFGLLTGQLFAKGLPQLGAPSGYSFCVRGNFSGLVPNDIKSSVVIRFENDWATTARLGGPPCIVFQSTIRGLVASNPR